MTESSASLFAGSAALHPPVEKVQGEFVRLWGESFYKIAHFDALAEPFFISLASSSDHWLFIASTGGLSAGRVNSERALFPYYTVDKLTEASEHTGGKIILRVARGPEVSLWEPFSDRWRGAYRLERNLYKDLVGSSLVFEEINFDLELTCRYAWRLSDKYGFIKTTWLANFGASARLVELLDGLQNILPANVASGSQNSMSVLLDAYKRSELQAETGLGLFSLSSNLSDLPEPSEALLATTVAQVGLPASGYLLSSVQLDRFRAGRSLTPESDVRGRRCAYFGHAQLELPPGAERSWSLLAEVHQDSAAVAARLQLLRGDREALRQDIECDIAANQAELLRLIGQADGVQVTRARLSSTHHLANVLFNIARGGVFGAQDWITAAELREFVGQHEAGLLTQQAAFFAGLPERLRLADLPARLGPEAPANLRRLCASYLPLAFSRRHGDPSRPWNQFTIHLKNADGSPRLGYEGNWRDIFQNWEALACSYPEAVERMINVFLNATTADGYNPYRITQAGVDWEKPEPHNPWSNIGYWSDHQIIYLLKLMEFSRQAHPGRLRQALDQPQFAYAQTPYRLKPYADLVADPRHSIDFDWDLQAEIEARVRASGTDGKLLRGPDGQVLHVSLVEKLLTLLLAKLANFVPEGGIWMNTQRPEWNDANNALVGNGLSVVTLGYLRRYVVFFRELLAGMDGLALVSREVAEWRKRTADILARFQPVLAAAFSPEQRRTMLDALGQAGGDYRQAYYAGGLSGDFVPLPLAELSRFLELTHSHLEHALRANRRADELYHSYNILQLTDGRAGVRRLQEMLEGQVSSLSSGLLSAAESLALLGSLRRSALYRADQHSYILYPDRDLPGFLAKNNLPAAEVQPLGLVRALVAAGEVSLIVRDVHGGYHFSGDLRNAREVTRVLEDLRRQPAWAEAVARDGGRILEIYEDTFRHAEFTGRSGTFFAYEGLGSIYWHMVSKLLLAVQETAVRFASEPEAAALRACYRDVRAGLGYHKTPAEYGAFPTDPYSHTPKGQGAKQPGMTGAVKEEILTRQAELGLSIRAGQLVFDLALFEAEELLLEPAEYVWLDVAGQRQTLALPAGSLAYSVCQTPIVLRSASAASLEVHRADGGVQTIPGLTLDAENSRHIFQRDGQVQRLVVSFVRAA